MPRRPTTTSFLLTGALWMLFAATPVWSQSLAEVAKRERERRAALRERRAGEVMKAGQTSTAPERTKPEHAKAAPAPPVATSAPAPVPVDPVRPVPQTVSNPEKVTNGASVPHVPPAEPLALSAPAPPREPAGTARTHRNWRGSYSLDWIQGAHPDAVVASQLSGRFRVEGGEPSGEGWRALLDMRDRVHGGPRSNHRLMLYDAQLTYENRDRPFGLSVGRMNVYDSAGGGPLLGAVLSYRMSPGLRAGTYTGIEADMYVRTPDPRSQKYGFFTRYTGSGGRSLAASYNLVRVRGASERQFLYTTGLYPLLERAVIFGSLEYELAPDIASQDRLSRFFLNTRYDLSPVFDITGYASSGRGLDYRRWVLAQVENRSLGINEVRRFYYSQQYGARLHFKPRESPWTIFVAQGVSEQKDRGIRNHTTELGGSLRELGGSGLSLHGSSQLNRGDSAESSSYRISASREFGSVSWTGTYSSLFTGIRLDPVSGLPELLHLSDRRTASNELFWVLNRGLALSLEHELSSGQGIDENTFYVRVMGRF